MKNSRLLRLALFIATMIAAASYPAYKIITYEFPADRPAVYRFRSGIVDPYDPFRGRYAALRPLPDSLDLKERIDLPYGGIAYAVLSEDSEGLASIKSLALKPAEGEDCLKVRVFGYMPLDDKGGLIKNIEETKSAPEDMAEARKEPAEPAAYRYRVRLPFDRYYMNEKLAPEAEKAVAEIMRGGETDAVVIKVRVYKDGNYAIEDLELNGTPIKEALKERLRDGG
jgi:hypothetical protein